jgi:prepilin-type N-terminal cleavage/methylation domain-containing protein
MQPVEPDLKPVCRASGGRAAVWRGGFTIVEIMTVIGILLILVSIAVIAYRSMSNPTAGGATKVTLHNLQGELAEYEAAAGLRNQPAMIWRGGTLKKIGTGNPPLDLWKSDVLAPNDVANPPSRFDSDAVLNTQLAYQILNRIPANKDVVAKLPQALVLGQANEKGGKLLPVTGPDARSRIDPPLILDAWNNPIIYVGSRGLAGVDLVKKPGGDFDKPNQQVTSVGVFPLLKPTDPTPAGARPFFASAGPDGNFRTGDDNVYSFNP